MTGNPAATVLDGVLWVEALVHDLEVSLVCIMLLIPAQTYKALILWFMTIIKSLGAIAIDFMWHAGNNHFIYTSYYTHFLLIYTYYVYCDYRGPRFRRSPTAPPSPAAPRATQSCSLLTNSKRS